MRRCRTCGLEKPLDAFHKGGWSPTARIAHCKPCRSAKDKADRRANPEARLAIERAYRLRHPDRVAAAQARFKAARPERLLQIRRAWRRRNPVMMRDAVRSWRARFPEAHREQARRRRARVLAATLEPITPEQITALKAHFGHRCAYCGRKPKRLEIDHIVPLARGGAHALWNLVPACGPCNARKNVYAPPVPVQPVLVV